MKRATRGGRRLRVEEVLGHLRAADRFPSGDARREAAQRRAARAVAADPALAEHPAVAHSRVTLLRWARFAPYLLGDEQETALATTNRQLVSSQLEVLRTLDDEPATALATADGALRELDAGDPARRLAADIAAHAITDRRAPTAAAVLAALAACHLADDRRRGIADWRTRFALVQGTTPDTLAHLQAATREARDLVATWWRVRAPFAGDRYCDRRVGLAAPTASLAEHAANAAAGVAAASHALAGASRAAAGRIRPGADNEVVIEADGRISATVSHRPTPRGSLMVAHELGHTVHALSSQSPEPPGALVGETVACWSSLVVGRGATVSGGDAALALALGDTLVEELFVSAAVSAFEDSVYALAAAGPVSADELDAAWLAAHRDLFGAVVEVPPHVASGWARLPSLATDPGHALSYVWATVLALAIAARYRHDDNGSIAMAICAGGIDADEFTALLGFAGDEWIELGIGGLREELDRLAQLLSRAVRPSG